MNATGFTDTNETPYPLETPFLTLPVRHDGCTSKCVPGKSGFTPPSVKCVFRGSHKHRQQRSFVGCSPLRRFALACQARHESVSKKGTIVRDSWCRQPKSLTEPSAPNYELTSGAFCGLLGNILLASRDLRGTQKNCERLGEDRTYISNEPPLVEKQSSSLTDV
jgi:hypothetical protein